MIKIFKLIMIVLTVLLITSSNTYAECDGVYLAGRAGFAKYEIDDKHSSDKRSDYVIDKKRFMASGALGYRYEHFRGELEYVWRKKNSKQITEFTKGQFKSQSFMFVVYYDFFPYSWFTPFINAGIGYTRNKLSIRNTVVDVNYKLKENAFTWSLGAGISAKITNRWNLDLGYRYYDMGSLDTYNGKTSLDDQEIYLGLRYVL